MKAIAAVDKNWGIGNKGKLLTSIPEDMKFFRSVTLHHVVVMGRKTLESFPNGRPLKDRTNIVLTKDRSYKKDGVRIVYDLDELHEVLKEYDSDEIFVIGGESVYRQLIDECDEAYITYIDYAFDADAYFPDLSQKEDWKLLSEGEEETYYDLIYYFNVYKKQNA